jgi:hypothetical protein
MTLDEMLALLPDNTTGEISAADMRAIVTDLFEKANTYAQTFSYGWTTTGGSPSTGKVRTDTITWDLTPTEIEINETTADGYTLVFNLLDASSGGQIWLSAATGGILKTTIAGPSVDNGTWRSIPVTIDSVEGSAPLNNEKVTVTVLALIL